MPSPASSAWTWLNRAGLPTASPPLSWAAHLRKLCTVELRDPLMPLIAPEDRHAIDDLYAEYVWALDTGDVPAFLALFTPDGVFGDTAGNIYKGQDAIGAYVRALTTSARRSRTPAHHQSFPLPPERRRDGREGVLAGHQVDQGKSAPRPSRSAAIRMTCWCAPGSEWRFAQRLVHYWNDVDLPWAASAGS